MSFASWPLWQRLHPFNRYRGLLQAGWAKGQLDAHGRRGCRSDLKTLKAAAEPRDHPFYEIQPDQSLGEPSSRTIRRRGKASISWLRSNRLAAQAAFRFELDGSGESDHRYVLARIGKDSKRLR